MKSIVSYLASDSLHGREVSSSYEKLAADFIFEKFKQSPGGRPKRHYFEYQTSDSIHEWHSQNIYFYVNNHADSTVLIGAHYDHIGFGGSLSLAYSARNQIHNGADDNASGVALMLVLAHSAKETLPKGYNYLFAAYSAHEIGLFGSTAFYKFIRTKVKPIALMMNFDMVGRMDKFSPTLNILVSTKIRSRASEYFKSVQNPTKVFMNYDSKIFNTDCRIFESEGIESVSFTTGTHSDYHKPTDDPEKLNYGGINVLYEVVIKFLGDLKSV